MTVHIPVTRSSMPSYEEYCEEIRELWDSRWLTNNGKKHEQLRAALTDYLDAGLRDFCKTDDTPITLKALLFNRFCKMQDRTDPEAFKEFYQKYYS